MKTECHNSDGNLVQVAESVNDARAVSRLRTPEHPAGNFKRKSVIDRLCFVDYFTFCF